MQNIHIPDPWNEQQKINIKLSDSQLFSKLQSGQIILRRATWKLSRVSVLLDCIPRLNLKCLNVNFYTIELGYTELLHKYPE